MGCNERLVSAAKDICVNVAGVYIFRVKSLGIFSFFEIYFIKLVGEDLSVPIPSLHSVLLNLAEIVILQFVTVQSGQQSILHV